MAGRLLLFTRAIRPHNHRLLKKEKAKWTHHNYCSQAAVIRERKDLKPEYDAVVIGAGHNGLVAAAYLQRAGKSVCVLERRHVIGGAAVTEELVPGFKFSRASYVLSLLRPQVFEDLELEKYGLRVFLRDPYSYTPLLEAGGKDRQARSLTLGRNQQETERQIAQFSERDAKGYFEYEHYLSSLVDALAPLLDSSPPNISGWKQMSLINKIKLLRNSQPLFRAVSDMGSSMVDFYELLTAPASKMLGGWLESEPLKATLATDSVIGAMTSPNLPGSGYVLLHHVMGGIDIEGVKAAWGYVQGGMGSVSNAIARSAAAKGAHIFTETPIASIVVDANRTATGVVLEDGSEVKAKVILSNATPKVTYLDLIAKASVPDDFVRDVSLIDYTSPVTKINVAVSRLPNFLADPVKENKPGPQHRGTIHLNCEDSSLIHDAYLDACNGSYSKLPVIEMTIPSSIDNTVAPAGGHVVQLFTQYTPYQLADGRQWDEPTKQEYANIVFDNIEEYAPGFKASIIGTDILTPPDLERVFGLTGGNIFHGSMSLDQLFMCRPVSSHCDYRSPVRALYLCGSGAHPGGGVMGSPGRLAAMAVLEDKLL